jgi:LysR family glycine cleavage system transcriptional activator
MKPLPPLPALRAFEAVARLGSVVKAADELHVTHGAISQQVRALEEFLGFALFLRQGRRLAITEDGRIYAMRLRMALGDIASATSEVLALPRADELIVAVLPSFGAHWLVRRLPAFRAAFPGYKLTLRAGLELIDFQVDRVDAAVRMGPGGWEGVSQTRLFDDELVAVAAVHFNGGKLPRTPAAVMCAPLLRSVESWSPWLAAAGLPDSVPDGPIYTDSNLVVEALRQGQGVAVTRRSLVHDLIRAGELCQLTAVAATYANPYWLVWPPRSEGTAKQAAFADWLAGEVRNYLAEVATLKVNRNKA